jgi:hypothetical protein
MSPADAKNQQAPFIDYTYKSGGHFTFVNKTRGEYTSFYFLCQSPALVGQSVEWVVERTGNEKGPYPYQLRFGAQYFDSMSCSYLSNNRTAVTPIVFPGGGIPASFVADGAKHLHLTQTDQFGRPVCAPSLVVTDLLRCEYVYEV